VVVHDFETSCIFAEASLSPTESVVNSFLGSLGTPSTIDSLRWPNLAAYRAPSACRAEALSLHRTTSVINEENMNIREERPVDAERIRMVNLAAFETSTEADLVDA
jgi:hypothetical protein